MFAIIGAVNFSNFLSGKNGPYIDGYYTNGQIDINYNSCIPINIPNQPSCFFFLYVSGQSVDVNGAYSNGYFCYGQIVKTYCDYGIYTYPIQAIDNCLYYCYISGEAILADGPYSNNYFCLGCIDSSYTNLTPQIIINTDINDFNASIYHNYVNGNACVADGAFSNGFFCFGRLRTSYNSANCKSFTGAYLGGDAYINSPQLAFDTCLWYLYAVGNIAYIAPDGPYFVGYISNGQINTCYNMMTPANLSLDCIFIGQTSCRSGFLLFCDGCNIGMPQGGPYSVGYFQSSYGGCFGTFLTGYTNTISPQQAIDDCLYYTYEQGNSIIAFGDYGDYCYENGYRL